MDNNRKRGDVVIDGFLRKCGVGRVYSKWTTRWCVLTSDAFVYYTDETLSVKKGEYAISEACQISRYQGEVHGELSMVYCLQRMGAKEYELLLHTDDNATLLRWFEQIQNVIKEQKERNNPANVLMDGFLHKCGVGWVWSKWTRRWCLLTGNAFIYYRDESLTVKKREYLISEACKLTEISEGKRGRVEYSLQMPGRGGYELLLSADDKDTMARWVEQIQKAILHQSQQFRSQQLSVDNNAFLIRDSIANFPVGKNNFSPQPFVLHLSVLRVESPSSSLLKSTSNCYVKVLIRSRYFGKTGVQQRCRSPVWHENFSIPLNHLKQGQLTLELWDEKGQHKLLGSSSIDLVNLPLSQPVVDQGSPITCSKGTLTSSTLFVSMFVEEIVDTIKLVPQTTTVSSRGEPVSSTLASFLVKQGALVNASDKIIEAFHASEVLPDLTSSSVDHCLVRDMVCDAVDMFPTSMLPPIYNDEDDDEDDDELFDIDLVGAPRTLPMVNYPIAHNVDVIKSTDIGFSTFPVEENSSFTRSDNSFLLKNDDCEVVFVAPNRYVVFLWVREIRRHFAHHKHTKGSRAAKMAELHEAYHSPGLKEDSNQSLEGILKVEIRDKLCECLCSFNAKTLQLKYQDIEGVKFAHTFDMKLLTLISVAQDYAVPTPVSTRLSVKAGTLTLDENAKKKGAIAELQLKMKHIRFANTKIVLNCHEKTKVLKTKNADGLMPFWNNSMNLYLSQQDISSATKGAENARQSDEFKAVGVHMHMLSGPEGKERVLGSKFIPYSDVLRKGAQECLGAGDKVDSITASKISETVVRLDTNMGIRVVVMSGEDLLMPPSFEDDRKSAFLESYDLEEDDGNEYGDAFGDAAEIQNSDGTIVVMQGFLHKCGVGRVYSKWTTRWCVLSSDAFVYYTDETLSVKKGEYAISEACKVTRKSEDEDHNYVCCLQCPGRGGYELLLSADDEDTMARWFDRIQHVIDEKEDYHMRETCVALVAGDGVDRNPLVKVSLVSSKCVKNKRYQYTKTKKAWQTVNPHWNEAFLFDNARELSSAAYVQLLVVDKSRQGSKDELMGVVFLPLSECFCAAAVAGEVVDRTFDIESAPCMSKYVKTHAFNYGLGKLRVKFQLIVEDKSKSDGKLPNYFCRYNNVPPEVEMQTQLLPTNEHSSYYVCDSCVRSGYYQKDQIKSMERVLLAPGFDSLILLRQEATDDNESMEALFSKFHKKTRRPRQSSSTSAVINNVDKKDYDDILIFSFFENERRSMMMNWGSQHLFNSERRRFSDESGKYVSPYEPYFDIKMKPPAGYRWDTDYEHHWQLDLEYTVANKDDGFSYGLDFMDVMTRLRKNQSRARPRGRYFVRRRKWKRIAVKLTQEESETKTEEHGNDGGSPPVSPTGSTLSTRHRARDTLGQYPDLNAYLSPSNVTNGGDSELLNDHDIEKGDLEGHTEEPHTVTRLRYKIYHNQRRSITFKWEDGHLLSTDRKIYTDEKGKRDFGGPNLSDVLPPSGYRWVEFSEWSTDWNYTNTDVNGWSYGMDFSAISRDYNNGESQSSSQMKMVRRRRLVREMEETTETEQHCLPQDSNGTAASKQPQLGRISSAESTRGTTAIFDDIPTTKLEASKKSHDDIMKLCRERETLESPIIIPYEQVKCVDVVTPSILSVIVTVHRYFGEKKSGEEIYNAVEMELFILECPAEKLCQLICDRLTLSPIRTQAVKLIASGTITGDRSIPYDDHKCLNDDGSAVALSLGSQIMQRIFYEIYKAEDRIVRRQGTTRGQRTTSVIEQWTSREEVYCTPLLLRLKLYAFLLLHADLTGPCFEEERARELVRLDMQHADALHKQLTAVQDASGIAIMDAAKQTAQLLLDAAEMRISDYALCGWALRDSQALQNCITTLINGYYNNLVQELGYFFDSKDLLKSLAGNQSKLALIEFFIEYDSHLKGVIENALRPYQLSAAPEPNLSLALSVEELMSWYVVLLRIEMLDFVSRTFQISQKSSSTEEKSGVYELPWEVIKDENQRPISVIPMDVFNLVKQYFHLVTKFNKSCSSAEVETEIFFLNHKVHEISMECFVSLVFKYQAVVFRHDWTKLVETPGVTLTDEESFDAIGQHLLWLAGIANDIFHIDKEFYSGTINEISITNVENEINGSMDLEKMTQYFINVNSFSQEFSRQSLAVSHCALGYISSIFFQSFSELLPIEHIYEAWSESDEPEGLVHSIVVEIIWNLNARLEDLEPFCALYLLLICFRKFQVWYLSFIQESANRGISFTEKDFDHIDSDCIYMMKEFMSFLDKVDLSDATSKEIKMKEKIEKIVLASFSLHVLLCREIDSVAYEEVIESMHDEASREPYKAKSYLACIDALTSLRKKSCRDEQSAALVGATRQRFEDIMNKRRSVKSKNEAEKIFPCAHYVVFDKQVPLADYLFCDTSEASKQF